MKLITFQSFESLEYLLKKGFLKCDDKYVDFKKNGKTYEWIVQKMNSVIENPENIKYPIWAWVKCYNGICPSKRKGEPVKGYDVKITFYKDSKDVFITDFRRYSFLLNNMYIPDSITDKENFDRLLKKHSISEEDLKAYVRSDKYKTHRKDEEFLKVCAMIRESFNKCITSDSDILQGCVWKINLSEIESIDFLNDKAYRYGSLNYIRSNGSRMNWREDFYKKLCVKQK